jgi:hypothetical protein
VADARLICGLGWLLPVALLGACATAAAAPPQPVPVAPAAEPISAPAPELDDGGWGLADSKRHSLEMPLPDRASWSLDDSTTPWFVAVHERTRSELSARIWRAGRLVRPSECERQARLWKPAIPGVGAESVLEARRLSAPPGWTTELTVGVERVGAGQELRGFALAYGATVGRCYAFVYTTFATGAGAQASIGRRLAIVADEIVPQVRMRSIDERVR